jgi:hypothetical protein
MPRLCKECKHEVSWAARECPVCGIDNPTGMDREVLWMIGAAGFIGPILLIYLYKTWSRALF